VVRDYKLSSRVPGADSIPRPGDVARWKERFGELLEEQVVAAGGHEGQAQREIGLARVRAQVGAFLDAEAACETDLRPRPDLLERKFGFDEGPDALDLDEGIALRGSIDRIDLAADGSGAVVRDYKLSSRVPGAGEFGDRGVLQVQLYLLAARERLGLEPIAGLYQPLGATKDRRPRGMAVKDDERLDGLDLSRRSRDMMEPEQFESELERARELARERARAMLSGTIDRDPLNDSCPSYCTYQSICRIERVVGDTGGGPGANGNGNGEAT